MIINQLIDEDFVNYKFPSMYIGFPKCTFKCEKECGLQVCQNSVLATSPTIDVDVNTIIERYMSNKITKSIVIAGLEPFDTFEDLYIFICNFREKSNDDIVIYTGYYRNEIQEQIDKFKCLGNIVIKFGRFIPDQKSHYDEVLGVNLASNNQYAERM